MQEDMHYYGTYAIARTAGIPQQHAKIIAHSAQYVDDSTEQDSTPHEDGGLIYGIATAHHSLEAVKNAQINQEEQRRVWVPFHFIPGGEGDTLEEKLLCVKNSLIARSMIKNHIQCAIKKPFGLHLVGIAAHVYMDTFSHYGFSGISSKYNGVESDTIKLKIKEPKVESYVLGKLKNFFAQYTETAISLVAETLSNKLGHGGVGTLPDRPFLHWSVEYEENRPNNGRLSDRNNPQTFLEGCGHLHTYLSQYAKEMFSENTGLKFEEIRETVAKILHYEGDKAERIQQWREAIKAGVFGSKEDVPPYRSEEWENEKKTFHELKHSGMATKKNVYCFHQAAFFHRFYLLKELLPKHDIVVY